LVGVGPVAVRVGVRVGVCEPTAVTGVFVRVGVLVAPGTVFVRVGVGPVAVRVGVRVRVLVGVGPVAVRVGVRVGVFEATAVTGVFVRVGVFVTPGVTGVLVAVAPPEPAASKWLQAYGPL
jgi:hypothetical protein